MLRSPAEGSNRAVYGFSRCAIASHESVNGDGHYGSTSFVLLSFTSSSRFVTLMALHSHNPVTKFVILLKYL